jgi:hypothetical protein
VTAQLVTAEGAQPVEGRTIAFFADGEPIGEATTDATGTASMAVPPQYRSSKATFCTTFNGDDTYSGSGDC